MSRKLSFFMKRSLVTIRIECVGLRKQGIGVVSIILEKRGGSKGGKTLSNHVMIKAKISSSSFFRILAYLSLFRK